MQGIPIKFRGKPISSSESDYIYGDYVTIEGGCAIRVKIRANLFHIHEYEIAVKPETVAQLVGYDANGKEVYEGDTVDAFFGTSEKPSHNFPAALSSNIEAPTDLDFKFVKRG